MNRIQYAILIVFFIFLVSTASAIEHKYVSLTATPGEEISQATSFTGAYKRLFATADASGSAALWVTPRRIDFGPINPGETIEREYTISVPRSQKPGYYELVWKYSCKYTDGTACTVASDTVLQITVEAELAQTGRDHKSITLAQGEELNDYLSFSARSDEYGLYAWADASGNAASWVTPRRIDFGEIGPGESINKYYTIRAPKNQKAGYYELIWTWSCGYRSGETCKPVTGVTALQINVEAKGRAVFTPAQESSTGPVLIVLIFFLILFIVWIYVLVWVVRDANKRGKSGTFWGIVAFFLGLLGVIIYLIVRPTGNLVSCNYCGKEKLETLTQCPHCRKSPTPVFIPAPTPMKAEHPAIPQKTEVDIGELKKQKEKLNKINALLEKLDERLAQGEITEDRYKELCEQYRAEAESLKNLVTEKELLQEVGLKALEKEEVEPQEEEPEKAVFKERRTKYCSNCGALIDEKAEICPECGVRVLIPQVYRQEKSGALAAFLSFLIPGVGQMYCGRGKRGLGILILNIFLFFLFGSAASEDPDSGGPGILFLLMILVWIWNISDAYKLAKSTSP